MFILFQSCLSPKYVTDSDKRLLHWRRVVIEPKKVKEGADRDHGRVVQLVEAGAVQAAVF